MKDIKRIFNIFFHTSSEWKNIKAKQDYIQAIRINIFVILLFSLANYLGISDFNFQTKNKFVYINLFFVIFLFLPFFEASFLRLILSFFRVKVKYSLLLEVVIYSMLPYYFAGFLFASSYSRFYFFIPGLYSVWLFWVSQQVITGLNDKQIMKVTLLFMLVAYLLRFLILGLLFRLL